MRTNLRRESESTAHRQVTSVQGTAAAVTPLTVLEHWHERIVSVEQGDMVLDLRNFRSSKPLIWRQDLRVIPLFGGMGAGVYKGKVLNLGDFPHLVSALEAALIADLQIKHKGRPDKSVPMVLGTSIRIFCWMLCTKHYRLGDLTQKRVTELVEQLGTSGWYEALNMQGVLKSVLQRATESPSLAVRLMPSANSMNSRGINGPVLREITGLPFTGPEVPMDIRRQLFELAKRPWPAESKLRAAGYAPGSSLKTTMESFNRLSLLPPPADCLAFLPFPSISAQMKHLGKAPGQTPNLALDDAARIFRACTTWLYDRAPLLLEVLASARAVFERREADAVTTHTIDTQASRAARATAARLTSPHATPHWMENLALKKGENSLARRLYMVQIAAACQIGINHGRRVNEVVGEKLPYGIYRGCVRPVAGLLHEWRIDIYCEKNTQGYRSFPANALVFDAVSVLEKLANLLRPLNTLPLAVNADIAAARMERLLTTRNLTSWGFREPLYDVNFRDYLTEFLVDAGVNPEKFHGQQWPFRRFFCILYTNKHDNPELLALSEHLDHLGVPSTLPYVCVRPSHIEYRLMM